MLEVVHYAREKATEVYNTTAVLATNGKCPRTLNFNGSSNQFVRNACTKISAMKQDACFYHLFINWVVLWKL